MNFESVRSIIDTYIKKNGVEAITGDILNNVLNTMLDDVDTAISSIEPSPGGGGGGTADLSNYYTKAESDARYLALNGGGQVVGSTDTPLYLKSGVSNSYIGFKNSSDSILGYYGFRGTTPIVYSGASSAYYVIHSGNVDSYALPYSGGTITGDLSLNKYLRINAWEGYGSGSANIWYDGTIKQLKFGDVADMMLQNGEIVIHSGNIGSQSVASAKSLVASNGTTYVSYNSTYGQVNVNGINIGYGGNTIERASSGKLYIQKNVTQDTILNQYGGKVGIRTDNPSTELDVNGTIATNQYIRINAWTGYGSGSCDMWYDGGITTLEIRSSVKITKNLIVAGDFSFGSDMRFKDKIEDMGISIADIAKAPLFTYKWKDRDDDVIYLGSSAQYWEKIAPWLVSGSDFKSLNYATLGVAMGISLAKKTINHEERIKILEAELKRLKREQYGS